MFSTRVKYSLRALLYLSVFSDENRVLGVVVLAEILEVNKPVLAKELQSLSGNGFINSKKGRNGGFFMTEYQKNIPLKRVILKLNNNEKLLEECLMGQRQCDGLYLCPFRDTVNIIRNGYNQLYDVPISQIGAKIFNKSKIIEI